MAENHEKQCFTFFAFLPPYIGVSSSLVSRMRKITMRSIEWYQKFLISRLVARYSAVFVFLYAPIGDLHTSGTRPPTSGTDDLSDRSVGVVVVLGSRPPHC